MRLDSQLRLVNFIFSAKTSYKEFVNFCDIVTPLWSFSAGTVLVTLSNHPYLSLY